MPARELQKQEVSSSLGSRLRKGEGGTTSKPSRGLGPRPQALAPSPCMRPGQGGHWASWEACSPEGRLRQQMAMATVASSPVLPPAPMSRPLTTHVLSTA